MSDWFTIDRIDKDSFIISEYRHWEETHCYLLNGTERSLLIDTGLGICNIRNEVIRLTDLPVTAPPPRASVFPGFLCPWGRTSLAQRVIPPVRRDCPADGG